MFVSLCKASLHPHSLSMLSLFPASVSMLLYQHYQSVVQNAVDYVLLNLKTLQLVQHVFVATVYIASSANPKANTNEAFGGLHDAISEILAKDPDSFVVIGGDFNHAGLKTMLPKFKQFVDLKTRGENILDLVCMNFPDAYKAIPRLITYLLCWYPFTNQY